MRDSETNLLHKSPGYVDDISIIVRGKKYLKEIARNLVETTAKHGMGYK